MWDDWCLIGLGMDSRGMTGALSYLHGGQSTDSREGPGARMHPRTGLGLEE